MARAPIRKLGHAERFVGPALHLTEMDREPTHPAVIKTILRFDHAEDAEAVELRETIGDVGERAALARYAGIGADHPLVDLVLERPDPARG